MLRKAGGSTVRDLWDIFGSLVEIFEPAECVDYFSSCGRDPDRPKTPQTITAVRSGR
jgi:hypothetical protein